MVVTNEILVILLLAVLGLLFYLVFRWSQRNEQASYLGKVFQEAVFDFELSRRTRRVEEKRVGGEYQREALQDESLEKYPNDPKVPPELLPYVKKSGRQRSYLPDNGFSTLPGLPREDPWDDTGDDPWDDGETRDFWNISQKDLPENLKSIYSSFIEKR